MNCLLKAIREHYLGYAIPIVLKQIYESFYIPRKYLLKPLFCKLFKEQIFHSPPHLDSVLFVLAYFFGGGGGGGACLPEPLFGLTFPFDNPSLIGLALGFGGWFWFFIFF
jgi:hypothetical protein